MDVSYERGIPVGLALGKPSGAISHTREREMRESDNRLRALRPRGGGGGFEAQQLAGGVGGAITCSLFLVLAVRLGCEVYALKNIGVPRP